VLVNAIAIDSRYEAHEMLGMTLKDMGRLDDAITSLREAVRIDPSQALVRNQLMFALIARGSIEDARTEARLLIENLPENDPQIPEATSLLNLCDLINQLAANLPAILDGSRVPQSIPECLAFADLFRGRQDHRAAARYYADAFDRLGSESWSWRTFDAARCAALAGASVDDLEDSSLAAERARWRSKALGWLRVGLRVFDQALTSGAPRSKLNVQWGLMEMKAEAAFDPFRDAVFLDRLPEDERDQWRVLWAEVGALLARAKSVT